MSPVLKGEIVAVQFAASELDELLAPGISSFNDVTVPDLRAAFAEEDHWLANLFLNGLVGPRYKAASRQAATTLIFRTQSALRAYHSARVKTLECVASFAPGRPAIRPYFEAVSHWETVLLNIQIAVDLFTKMMSAGTPLTDEEDRIRNAANRVKHFAEDIRDGKNSGEVTLPLWLRADGLVTRTANVTFAELAESLREMGKAADILQNPEAETQPSPAGNPSG